MLKNIAVIGSGSIGPDLAYGFAGAIAGVGGCLILHDISESQLEKGLARIQGYLAKGVARGKVSPKKAERIAGALQTTTRIEDLRDCDFVLEAATENLSIKHRILADLEKVVSRDCLIGFATSGIPRKQIVAGVNHPERCFVNHPFFPAWRSQPIELVPSEDPFLSKKMFDLLIFLGKVPIITADVPCFAADDVFCNFECEAFRILQDGIASVWQIDRIVNDHIGGGGPFNVADLTQGNPLIVHCQELMAEDREDGSWFRPPEILIQKGAEPWRDKKRGDSDYDEETARIVMGRILAVVLSRSLYIAENDICDASDLDWLLRNSLGFKQGFLKLAREMGVRKVTEICSEYAAHNPGFEMPRCLKDGNLPEYLENVVVKKDEQGIVQLLVRRPEVINALNSITITELTQTLKALDADDTVKGIVFGGFGGGLAGADIGELASLPTPEACAAICKPGHDLTLFMERLSKPVVAAINGPALGGGAEFCMGAWARVVGKRSIIGQPETNLGIIPGYGGSQRLPRHIGLQKANELLRTGRPMTAKQACEWGWATGEPVDDPFETARELILKHLRGELELKPLDHAPMDFSGDLPYVDIGHRSWVIDRILRKALQSLTKPLPEGLADEAAGFGDCKRTQDLAIGMANFMQNGPKVPAIFVHR